MLGGVWGDEVDGRFMWGNGGLCVGCVVCEERFVVVGDYVRWSGRAME